MPGAAVVVFLGPSLPREQAEAVLQADYRPPAKRGDIYQAAREGAGVICLIDGVFFQECSVAHKEVIYALEAGARVLGASSMGALRASEQFREKLFLAARRLYFPHRTYQSMLQEGSKDLPPEEMDRLRLFLERESRDFKMEDALLALKRARELAGSPLSDGKDLR